MVHTLYSAVLYLLSPVVLSKLLVRISSDRKYLDRLPQRFGFGLPALLETPAELGKSCIWIHAVSVGEVNAAIPLVRKIQEQFPGLPIMLTTMTPTGAMQAENTFGEGVVHCYLAYDYPGSVRRFIRKIKPAIAIFMETEIWPNYLKACAEQHIPIIFVNARLSEKSYLGYRYFRQLISASLRMADAIAVQAQMDAGRLVKLGARDDAIHITGNIKFDIAVSDDIEQTASEVRNQLGACRPVWIAGSTHPQEEAQMLEAHAIIKQDYPKALLILVPRHPERSGEIMKLCARSDCNALLHSSLGDQLSEDADIVIGDTMGRLPILICASDVAFIGGSLVPVGGHNVLEACAVGVPVIFGPHMFNFQSISGQVLARGAGLQVMNPGELAESVCKLLGDSSLRESYGAEGQRFVRDNRGAVERVYRLVEKQLLKTDARL